MTKVQPAPYGASANKSTDASNTPRGTRLIIYFNGTFVHKLNGAHVRVFSLLRWAVQTFPRVTLYSYRNHPDCPWTDQAVATLRNEFPNVELILENFSRPMRLAVRIKNLMLMLAPQLGLALIGMQLPLLTPRWHRLRHDQKGVLVINYVDGLTELNGVDLRGPVFIETHDLKFLHYARKLKLPISNLRVMGKLRGELASTSAVTGLIAISPSERDFLSQMLPDQRVYYIPSYFAFQPRLSPSSSKSADFLFVGSASELNVSGLVSFLAEGWRQRYTLTVAGAVCSDLRVQLAVEGDPSVELLGFVPDIDAVYATAKVSISPVDGAGLKIKVVEALEHGLPVLASADTLAGLPEGFNACVLPLTQESASLLLDENAENLNQAGLAAINYITSPVWLGDLQSLTSNVATNLSADDHDRSKRFESV